MTDAAFDPESLRDGFRDVLEREVSSERLHRFVDSGELRDEALWQEAAGLGWPALAIPEEHGGLGLGIAEAAVLFEEIGRVLAPLPLLGSYLAARAIALAGSEEQKAAWLPRIASGEVTCAMGKADSLLDGADANLLVLEAEQPGGGAAWMLVEGAKTETRRTVDRTRHLARLASDALQGAWLQADDSLADTLLGEAALLIACDAKGGASAILERTIDYLKTREQFGKPIGSFQALKHRCADHKVAIEASGAVVAEAVRLWAAGDPSAAVMAASAKAYACDVYAKVAEDAVQLHGGIGYTWEHDCHLYLKRAKLNQALFGTSAATLDRAARLLLEAA